MSRGVGKPKGHLDPDKDILLAYEGRFRRFPPDMHDTLDGVPNLFRWVRRIRELILENRLESAGHDIDAMVQGFCSSERQGNDLMRAGHIVARRRLDYWGITDPENEWWCSYCKQIKPLEQFAEGRMSALCEDCRTSKRKSRRRGPSEKRLSYAERVKAEEAE